MEEKLFVIIKYETDRYHVFEYSGEYDKSGKINYGEIDDQTEPVCNFEDYEENLSSDSLDLKDPISQSVYTSSEIRETATRLRNNGHKVCGTCMSHMFSDNVL